MFFYKPAPHTRYVIENKIMIDEISTKKIKNFKIRFWWFFINQLPHATYQENPWMFWLSMNWSRIIFD